MSKHHCDVIVVGAGFSGLIATRELESLGYRVLVLEARDRLGGRAWTDEHFGRGLEMGGAYVHWYQPHLWTELTRYGFDIYRVAQTEKVYWITDGELRSASAKEYASIFMKDIEAIMKKANDVLPQPFKPLEYDSFTKLDGMNVTEFFDQFDLTKEQRDIFDSLTGINFNGPIDHGALTNLMRWWVFSNGNRTVFADTVGRYKVKGGISSLIKAIAAELQAEIKLSTVVKTVEQTDEGVTVYAENGEKFHASTTIVTVPYSTLDKIEFSPRLSATKEDFISEKQVARGLKMWILLKGTYDSIVTYAPMDYPLQSIIVDDYIDGNTLFVGFGKDASILDPTDKEAVERAVRHWLPDAEVIDCAAHNWATDPFSLESWPMFKPHQLTKYIKEMRRPENNLFIAGTTYANGWAGFFDGAIENGITTARNVHDYLTKK